MIDSRRMSLLLTAVTLCWTQTTQLDQLLTDLDKQAATLQQQLLREGEKNVNVSAVVNRDFGGRLLRKRSSRAHSEFNFKLGKRVGIKRTKPGHFYLVPDDRVVAPYSTSRFWSLGRVEFDHMPASRDDADEGMRQRFVLEGHVYVLHTENSSSNFWSRLQALKLKTDGWMIFRWELITDPETVDLFERRLEDRAERTLQAPRVRLQLHSGTSGARSFRVYMHGKTTSKSTQLSGSPLDMEAPFLKGGAQQHTKQKAYIEGGYVPKGKVWVIRKIEFSGRLLGSKPRFLLHVGDRWIANIKNDNNPFKKKWAGWIVVRPGEEIRVHVDIEAYGKCEVVISGEFWDQKDLVNAIKRDATGEERERVDSLLALLDDDKVQKRDAAMRQLMEMGPPILHVLQEFDAKRRSKELQSRLKKILHYLTDGDVTP